VKVAPTSRLWLKCVIAYSLGGLTSAVLVGFSLGTLGVVMLIFPETLRLTLLSMISTLFILRDVNLVSFRILERQRQTERSWVNDFGFLWASAMWGMHVGFGFGTRMTYGGLWILAVACVALGDLVFACGLMVMFWAGRCISVWLAPLLLSATPTSDEILRVLAPRQLPHRPLVIVAQVWCVVATLIAMQDLK